MSRQAKFSMRMVAVALGIWLTAFSTFTPSGQAQQSNDVDLNLVLAIDCSYSVNAVEYALQMAGMASAFTDPAIIRAIEGGVHGAIAVTVVQWSHQHSQIIVVPWMKISNRREAFDLAAMIASARRRTSKGSTSISGVLKFSQRLLSASPYRAVRNVIDVVADGENNNGERVEWVRNRLNANGITINALAILNEVSYLKFYMQNRVIGGNAAFAEYANDYSDFAAAILRKMFREIEGAPMS